MLNVDVEDVLVVQEGVTVREQSAKVEVVGGVLGHAVLGIGIEFVAEKRDDFK